MENAGQRYKEQSIEEVGQFTVPPKTAQCLKEIYKGVTKSKSIQELSLYLFPSSEVPMIDLNYMVRNNQQLKKLVLESKTRGESVLSPDQGILVSDAVRNSMLQEVDIFGCRFDDHSLEQIIEACSRLRKLAVNCRTVSQSTALATLLHNPSSMMAELAVSCCDTGLLIIAASLRGNEKLLKLQDRKIGRNTRTMTLFSSLLCDDSSIEGIQNSNHTLVEIEPKCLLPSRVKECLELNLMGLKASKSKVIHYKIAKYHFNGPFDVTPFLNMPISIIPRVFGVMGLNVDKKVKPDSSHYPVIYSQSMYKILRSIPELSNARERDGGQHKQGS
jgi:hypothetical protein